jgi:Tfp pilus assembly protein FimT
MNRLGRVGFSLLELLIVLSVMVGVVAVAFPRLTRPLAESEVQRAAGGVREVVGDCRQTASFFGQPLVMCLKAGSDEVVWGDWAGVIGEDWGSGVADDVAEGRQSPSMAPEDSGQTGRTSGGNPITFDGKPRRYRLPYGMVVEAVHWATRGDDDELPESVVIGGSGDDMVGPGGRLTGEGSTDTNASPPPPPQTGRTGRSGGAMAGGATEGRWYIAFLPSGRCRDSVIVVRDTATGMRAALEIDAVSGLSRVTRLPAFAPNPAGA